MSPARKLCFFLSMFLILGPALIGGCQGKSASPVLSPSVVQTAAPAGQPAFTRPPDVTPLPSSVPTLAPAGKPAFTRPPDTITPSLSTPTATVEEKLGLHSSISTGSKKYLVILADFPDVKRAYPIKTTSSRMGDLLGPYFEKMSYSKLKLEGNVTGPYMLPHPVAYYRISPRNLEVDPVKVTALVSDVINAADKEVDLGQYAYFLIGLGATQPDYGMVGYCALPGMFAFQSKTVYKSASGKPINNVAVFCENAHMGTFIHDFMHMIGGYSGDQRLTPCLYDHDLQMLYPIGDETSKIVVNMGFWDPLSSHFPYNKELPPAGISSWTRLRLNWIDPEKIALVKLGQTATIKLDPLTSQNASTYVIKIPVTDKTYYLVENRQKIDSDANCPTTGILIMYADDTVFECRQGKAPVRIMDANPAVLYMNDATYDVGKKEKFVDAKNNLAIMLEKKEGLSYYIRITTAN